MHGATRARVSLGLLAAHRGRFAEAIAALEPVIAEAWVTPATHADAFAALGHA